MRTNLKKKKEKKIAYTYLSSYLRGDTLKKKIENKKRLSRGFLI